MLFRELPIVRRFVAKPREYTTASFHEPGESKPGSAERVEHEKSMREGFEQSSLADLQSMETDLIGILPRNYQWRMDLLRDEIERKEIEESSGQ